MGSGGDGRRWVVVGVKVRKNCSVLLCSLAPLHTEVSELIYYAELG